MLGYTNFSGLNNEGVTTARPDSLFQNTFFRTKDMKLSYKRPTSFNSFARNSRLIASDLHRFCSHCQLCYRSWSVKRGLDVYPNGQLSKLGDRQTSFRNSWSVKFRAIVCKQLTLPFIGCLVFMKQNGIMQDFARNVIHVLDQQITVQPTDPIMSTIPDSKKVTTTSWSYSYDKVEGE